MGRPKGRCLKRLEKNRVLEVFWQVDSIDETLKILNIGRDRLQETIHNDPAFGQLLQKVRESDIDRVEESMIMMALGINNKTVETFYEAKRGRNGEILVDENGQSIMRLKYEKTKSLGPDVRAQEFLLKAWRRLTYGEREEISLKIARYDAPEQVKNRLIERLMALEPASN